MHSPARRSAKALAGLAIAAGLALAVAPLGRAASIGKGAIVKPLLSETIDRNYARVLAQNGRLDALCACS